MKQILLFIAVVLLLSACGSEPTVEEQPKEEVKLIFDVNELKGKTEDQLIEMLGEADSREETTFEESPAATLTFGSLEIMVIDGKAQRVTYTPNKEVAYPDGIESFLKELGIEDPTMYVGNEILTKASTSNIYKIHAFGNNGKVDYLYFIFDEQYK